MSGRATLLAALLAVAAAAPAAAQDRPRIVAPAAILVEPSTGDVVFSRESRTARPMASTTKLMTALVALDRASTDDLVTVPRYRGLAVESVAGLRAGDRMTVADLIRALILPSGNDAALALARGTAGTEATFVRAMNERARRIGLRSTRFVDPIGLGEGNRSTPEDLVKLTLVLRRSPFFRSVADSPRATLRSADPDRTVVNRIALVRDVPEVTGVKSGRTNAAGYVLVGSAQRRGVTVVSVVMGDPSEAQRDADTLALLRFGLSRYRRATLLQEGAELASVPLAFRDERVTLVALRRVRRVVRKGERARVRVTGVPAEVDGPLPRGTRLGTAEVRVGRDVVARVPLVTARAVDEAGLGQRVRRFVGRPVTVLALGVLALASLLLAVLRRRSVRPPRRRPGDRLA